MVDDYQGRNESERFTKQRIKKINGNWWWSEVLNTESAIIDKGYFCSNDSQTKCTIFNMLRNIKLK